MDYKKRGCFLILCLVFIFSFISRVAADVGPKPSIRIDFDGFDEDTYYVTLLAEEKSTGPHRVYEGSNKRYDEGLEEIWEKFVTYEDKDDFHFLQYFVDCNSLHPNFEWGYYPPKKFKILIYRPKTDQFISSDTVMERYAFHSYYQVRVKGDQILSVRDHYEYAWSMKGFVARVLFTFVVELLIAFLFGFRKLKHIKFIFMVNLGSQFLLNLFLLCLSKFLSGSLYTLFFYLMELGVILFEAYMYLFLKKRKGVFDGSKGKIIRYTVTANVLSYLLGFVFSFIRPDLF